jgi:hypothetical protein
MKYNPCKYPFIKNIQAIGCLLIILIGSQSLNAQVKSAQKNTTVFYYKIISSFSNTFGYDIYKDGKLYIHQPTIPALNGNKGLADTTKAGSTARFVITKIEAGIIPPSVTVEELRKIKVI